MDSLSLSICACCAAIMFFRDSIRLFHCSADIPPEGFGIGAGLVLSSISSDIAVGFAGRSSLVITFGFGVAADALAFCFSRFSFATSPRDWPYAAELISNAMDRTFGTIRYIQSLPCKNYSLSHPKESPAHQSGAMDRTPLYSCRHVARLPASARAFACFR